MSGDTHLIGFLYYLVFSMLLEKESTFNNLLDSFLVQFPSEDPSAVEGALGVSLDELSRCRLIVSAVH